MSKQNTHWDRVKLGDVVERHQEICRNALQSGFTRFLKVEHMDAGSLRLLRWGSIEEEELPPTFYNVFRSGHVLFPSRNPHLRRVVCPDFDGICGEKTFVLRAQSGLLQEFLPFLMQSTALFEHAVSMRIGSTNPHVRWKDLANFEFPLPPVSEQLRMVEMLGTTENAIQRYSDIARSAFDLWRALSRQEFEGRAHKGAPLDKHYTITSGQVDPKQAGYASLPLIAPNHIESARGRILELVSAEAQAAISGKYLYEKGAILYSKIRPELRKATIAPCRGLCSADMYPLIPSDQLRAGYLLEILLSESFSQFAISGSMRTGMPKVNRKHLAEFKFDLPDIATQDMYLQHVNAISDAVDEVSNREDSLKQLKRNAMALMGIP